MNPSRYIPAAFRSRIERIHADDCSPHGIPRPTAEELERYERAAELLTRALPFTP